MIRYIFSFWPWKQSRYSSFCGAVVTWMMEMGKLWEDAAKTAEARVTSFLSKNSAQRIFRSVRQLIWVWNQRLAPTKMNLHRRVRNSIHLEKRSIEKRFIAKWHLSGRWSTFQNILLHLNLVEFVGPNNDAVASEVDAATRFWCFDLLQKTRKSSTSSLVFYQSSFLRLTHLSDAELVQAFIMSKNCDLIGHSSTYTDPVINLWRHVHWR